MDNAKTMFLDAEKKQMWAEAGISFPGEKLHQVIQRALDDAPADQDPRAIYELRRSDVPNAFDHLKKLQSTGRARRYIEVSGPDILEVLLVEATLFDALMQAVALLLDVLRKLLGGAPLRPTEGAESIPPLPPSATQLKPTYVPSWKRGRQHQVGYDGPWL